MGMKRERPPLTATAGPTTTPTPPSFSSGSGSGPSSGSSSTTTDSSSTSASTGTSFAFPTTSSSSSSSSSSSDGDGDATINPIDLLPHELRHILNVTRPDSDIPWTSSSETCYYNRLGDDGCFHPRNCRDCLKMPGCMINQLGQCVSQSFDHYNGFMDFRHAIPQNLSGPHATNPNRSSTQQYHFPSKVLPYCPSNETTCAKCRHSDFRQRIDSRFCIGRTGSGANNHTQQPCVCISICETPLRDEVLVHVNCTDPLFSNTSAKENTHPLMSTPSMFTLVVAPIVLLFVTYRVWRRHARSRTGSDDTVAGQAGDEEDQDEDYDPSDSVWSWSTSTAGVEQPQEQMIPSGKLALSGWQAQRQEMIEKEQLLLSELSPGSRYFDFDNTSSPAARRQDGDTGTGSSGVAGQDTTSREVGPPPPVRTAADVRHRLYWDESELSML